jgi:hypothetical protein
MRYGDPFNGVSIYVGFYIYNAALCSVEYNITRPLVGRLYIWLLFDVYIEDVLWEHIRVKIIT